ncbi:hypothetical protein ACFY7C_29275 [Streptomyces sp. NPDC012769]|uniref:hypothetical protein n=1 Tax=Streptomyces sp. NPDC012769 TaxID=3364848 RepID=UPI0036AC306C
MRSERLAGSDPGATATEGRTFRRMLMVSMLVLFLEAALALVLGLVFGESREPEPGEESVSAWTLVFMPFLVMFALIATTVASAAVVVPSVLLGEVAGRRAGGPVLGWQLLLAGVGGALLWPIGGWRAWLAAWVCLGVAALVARYARQGYFVMVLVWGTLAVLAVFGLCGLGLWTGVIGD